MNVLPVSDPGPSHAVHYGGGIGFFCPGEHIIFCNLGCCSPSIHTTWPDLEPTVSPPSLPLRHPAWDYDLGNSDYISDCLGYDASRSTWNLSTPFNGELANDCGSSPDFSGMGDFIIDTTSFMPISGSPDTLVSVSAVSAENVQTCSMAHWIQSFDLNTSANEDFAHVADDHGTQSFSPNPVNLGQNSAVLDPPPMGSAFEACSTCGRRCKSRRDLSEHRGCHKKRHQCPEMGCEMTFATVRDLTRHKGSIHEKIAQKCSYCSKSFRGRRPDNLRRHLRICRKNQTK